MPLLRAGVASKPQSGTAVPAARAAVSGGIVLPTIATGFCERQVRAAAAKVYAYMLARDAGGAGEAVQRPVPPFTLEQAQARVTARHLLPVRVRQGPTKGALHSLLRQAAEQQWVDDRHRITSLFSTWAVCRLGGNTAE